MDRTIRPPENAIAAAVDESLKSGCLKSQRGAAIWDTTTSIVVAVGTNAMIFRECDGSDKCRAMCPRSCVHAEQAAILKPYARHGHLEMLHVKTVAGVLVPSGPPSCWQCSKLIAYSTLKAIWLYHEEGWRRYPARRFHELTWSYHTTSDME